MDLIHHPLTHHALRVAFDGTRRKLHLYPPVERLVLIGLPGSGNMTLQNQIVIIEAIEPEAPPESISIFMSRSIRHSFRRLRRLTKSIQNRTRNDNDSKVLFEATTNSMNVEMHDEPYLPALIASSHLWNWVVAG